MSYAFPLSLSAVELASPRWYVAYAWDWGKRAWASTGWVTNQFSFPLLSREPNFCAGEYHCEYTWGNTEQRWVKAFCNPASASATCAAA